jgi:hypothetical protein
MGRFVRFFAALEIHYEQARAALDQAWGLPNMQGTVTCIDPAAVAPRNSSGLIVLAVNDEFCSYPESAEMLSLMLGSGAVAEISEADYRAATERPLP